MNMEKIRQIIEQSIDFACNEQNKTHELKNDTVISVSNEIIKGLETYTDGIMGIVQNE